jgi:hypothetical protein
MNRWKQMLIAAALVVCLCSSTAQGTSGNPEQYQINVSVLQGDPHGSREAGTLKVLAEPTLVTRVGQEASYLSGGKAPVDGESVEFGNKLRVFVEAVGEAVRLKLSLEHTVLLESGEGTTRLRTDRALYTKMVKPGEVLTLGWGRPSERMWVEVSVNKLGE